ncbi:MAG: hypothetical protein AAFV93_18770 [Chloroflexota bacterium]
MTTNAPSFLHRLRYHHLMVAVLIVLSAFALRSVAIYQRAVSDPTFIPQIGTDHQFYLESAKGVLDGTFPTDAFYFHPGPSYLFAGIYTLFGSTDFILLTFVIALIDALTCGLIIGASWLVSQRAWGGYLAGILYAIYPVAIFYATTPLIAPLATFFVAGLTFFILWQKQKVTLWRTIILGIFAGLLAIHRLNLAPLAGLYLLWLLMLTIQWRTRILHTTIFTVLIVAIIAPFTYLNYQNSGGDFIPIATTGSAELYMANNRDSAGRHGITFAHEHIDMAYGQALIRDAQVAPEHFFGLLGYKFALFSSHLEAGNNLNFGTSQLHSPILRFPISFPVIAILGLLGLSIAWHQEKQIAIFLGLMIAWMCFGFVLVFAFGRIRFPVVVLLIILSSYTLITIWDAIRANQLILLLKRHLVAIIAIMLLYGFSTWALFPTPKLPPERIYADLPSDAVRLDVQFDGVTLVGWRSLDEWDYVNNGWIPIFESYAVELFWQVNQPTDISYNFFLAYIDDNQRYDAIDTPIGTVSFPTYTTDSWQAQQILGEIVTLRLDDDIPQERSAQIRLGVWYWSEDGLIINVPANSGEPNILIQTIAVFNNAQIPDTSDLPTRDVVFGDLITLRDYDVPTTGTIGETIMIPFTWEATNNITDDYRLFVHVVDEEGNIVTQADTRPIPHLQTNNWMVGYVMQHSIALLLPDITGTYEIYAGLYNNSNRLSVDAPDNRLLIGTIQISE